LAPAFCPAGWSQGSFSTQVFLKCLALVGEPAQAAAVASALNDLFVCVIDEVVTPFMATLTVDFKSWHKCPSLFLFSEERWLVRIC